MSRTFSRLVFASAVLAAAPLARADGPIVFHGLELAEAPATMTVETDDGWRFEPGIADGQLVGLLGVYSGDGGTEASIRLAWFEPIGEGRWSGLGWQGDDEFGVAAYVADLYQSPTLFERGSLAGADLSAVAPADDPATLHLGFDEADPWQPVLEVADANLVEVIVEAGGAGMPALAPMAMPVPVDGELCGSALEAGLNDIAGDYITAFGLDQQLTGDEDGDAGGCAGLSDWCFPRTTTVPSRKECSPWSGWTQASAFPPPYGTCQRTRTCTQFYTVGRLHWDCSMTFSETSGGPTPDPQTKAAGPSGCS